MKKKLTTLGLVLFLAVMSKPAFAEPEVDPRSTEVFSRVAGTEIALTPELPFEWARVRVVGPAGYVARKSYSDVDVLTLDLLQEGSVPTLDAVGRKVETTLASSLPDGHYRYEAVLGRPTGSSRVHGSLFAVGGTLEAPREGEAQVVANPSPQVLNVDDQLNLHDSNDNGLTWIELEANSSGGAILERWQIQNSGGDLHIVEDGDGMQDEVRVAILDDGSPRMGIGTTTPTEMLHVAGGDLLVEGSSPELSLERSDLSNDLGWQVKNTAGNSPDGGDFVIAHYYDAQLRIKRSAVEDLLKLENSTVTVAGSLNVHYEAAVGSLTSTTATVGSLTTTGTATVASLISEGDATVEGDFSVLSSREAKKDFAPVEADDVLGRLVRLPLGEWSYKDSSARHMGPVAEEFYAAFALGSSERTVNPLDLSGVAMVAIQALAGRLEEQKAAAEARLAERDRQIALLQGQLDDLARRLARLDESG